MQRCESVSNVTQEYSHWQSLNKIESAIMTKTVNDKITSELKWLTMKTLLSSKWCKKYFPLRFSTSKYSDYAIKSFPVVVQSPSRVWLLQPNRLQPAGLRSPWDFPGKNTGVGCHFLLQGIFPTQWLNPSLLLGRWILYHWTIWEALRLPMALTKYY